MTTPLATVGIASIGEMGAGIAKLLSAHSYRVLTNVSGRSSEYTQQRARAASVELVSSDRQLVEQSDYILSIVPPRDAASTAERFITAIKALEAPLNRSLYYVDLNAISPASARRLEERFAPLPILFIDGGIIGGPPALHSSGKWTKPSLVVSGPHSLSSSSAKSGPNLAEVLNMTHIASTIGPASGLKMCFASLSKGLTALSIQSFTAAHNLGVLSNLQEHLRNYSPKTGELAAKGLVGMPPKAYRWVDEMKEIAATFETEGGFDEGLFTGVSEVFRVVAEETELGDEKTGARNLGMTPEDVARLVSEGNERRKLKTE